MCHDPAARPPAPPQIGPVGDSGHLTLTASDGNAFSAAYALPASAPRAGIVVLPDVRGLHGFYIALAERLAEAGYAAISIDLFGRTAGLVDHHGRPEDFDWQPEIAATTPEHIDLDTAAAIKEVRSLTRPDLPVFTLGFCFGGSNAWRQSAGTLDLVGGMGLYGQPKRTGDAADHIVKPTLMLLAGNDSATPMEDQLKLVERMRSNGADVVDVIFPGAPHAFFDRAYAEWAEACEETWRQIIRFVDRLS